MPAHMRYHITVLVVLCASACGIMLLVLPWLRSESSRSGTGTTAQHAGEVHGTGHVVRPLGSAVDIAGPPDPPTGSAHKDILFSMRISESEMRALQMQKDSSGRHEPVIKVPTHARAGETVTLDASQSRGSCVRYSWEITMGDGSKAHIGTTNPVAYQTFAVTGMARGTLYLIDECYRAKCANFDIRILP